MNKEDCELNNSVICIILEKETEMKKKQLDRAIEKGIEEDIEYRRDIYNAVFNANNWYKSKKDLLFNS